MVPQETRRRTGQFLTQIERADNTVVLVESTEDLHKWQGH